jgi:hypothetical protein
MNQHIIGIIAGHKEAIAIHSIEPLDQAFLDLAANAVKNLP